MCKGPVVRVQACGRKLRVQVQVGRGGRRTPEASKGHEGLCSHWEDSEAGAVGLLHHIGFLVSFCVGDGDCKRQPGR